jgi:hypothetical protein
MRFQRKNKCLLVYLTGIVRVRHTIKDVQNSVYMVSANKIDHRPVHDEYLNRYTQIE